jgi:hypothetical protein
MNLSFSIYMPELVAIGSPMKSECRLYQVAQLELLSWATCFRELGNSAL